MRRVFSVMVLCSLALAAAPLAAEPLVPPSGEVVLTVSGEIEAVNALAGAQFDLTVLKKFPAREISTTTYWHDGMQHFKGVSAVAVLESLGLRGATLTVGAPDDYSVVIPMADLKAYEPIFALELNGTDLAEEAEGPVWLIFPYDEMTPEERERYTAWSVWALDQIKVGN